MDRYSKTGLRLERATPRRPPGATPSVPTSAGEEALLFQVEPQADSLAGDGALPESPDIKQDEANKPKQPES